MEKKKNRWYDAFPELSDLLEGLKELEKSQMNRIMKQVKKIITNDDPNLINRTVMSYPLGIDRRWYDKDPLTWMTINSLKFADKLLRSKVTEYLALQMMERKKEQRATAKL